MADKKQTAFIGAVVIMAVAGAYSFVSDFISSVKENKPSLVDTSDLKENAELFDIAKEGFENNDLPNVFGGEEIDPDIDFDTIGYVVRVTGPDTICINIEDVSGDEKEGTKIRLIGVDVPEDGIPYTDREGRADVKDLIKKKLKAEDLVYIEYDDKGKDNNGYTLAYVYFSDGIMVQEWMLRNGYATVKADTSNKKHIDFFMDMANRAREDKLGIWAKDEKEKQ